MMAQERIPFNNVQESGQDELGGASPIAMNVVTDNKGTVRRRPGIGAYDGALSTVVDAAGIAGVYMTEGGTLYAVSAPNPAGNIYVITSTTAYNISSAPGAYLGGSGKPVFAETEALLCVAAGADIRKIVLATNAASLLGGAPPQASHVIANSSRILANDMTVDRTKVRYSSTSIGTTDYSGHETWTPATGNTAGFFTAEARPDPVVAIAENTNEVFVFGSDTLQVYDPDATLVFAPGATREVGCGAPYSIVKVDQEFFWLDHRRRFVHSDGRSFEVLSDAIKDDLEHYNMATASDCYGYRVLMGHVDAVVFSFPSDGRAFVTEQGAGWGQWAGWDDASNQWLPFMVTASHIVNGSNANVVGTSDGRIGELNPRYSTDFGQRINAFVETGFLDRGTDARKQCVSVRIALRRGQSQTEASGLLAWRDNLGAWESPIPISLGASGETDIVVELRSLGIYRRRQWRFQFSGDADLALVSATEEYDVLAN